MLSLLACPQCRAPSLKAAAADRSVQSSNRLRCKFSRRPVKCDASGQPSVVVTGASTGIGATTCERMVGEGWKVFAGVRSQKDADKLKEKYDSSSLEPVLLDVVEPKSVSKAAAFVEKSTGEEGLRGLVNNAGVGDKFGPVEAVPVEDHVSVFAVNYFGVIRVTQAFLPLLKKGDDGGRIVNIGSVSGKLAFPFFSPYAGSKFALEALSDCARRELSPVGIKVALIEAGAVQTPIWSKSVGNVDSVMAAMSQEVREQYEPLIKNVVAMAKKAEVQGVTTDDVAALIEDALVSSNPRARYVVGRGTAQTIFFSKIFPDKLFDNLVMRYLTK